MNEKLILASASPRRKQILELAGIEFEVVRPGTDESYPPGMDTEEIPAFIALQKALAVKEQLPGRRILAADTIVVLDGRVLGKPSSAREATGMLQMLSGRTHIVITGVAFLDNGNEVSFSDRSEVTFNRLSTEQIEYYVSTFKPMDKAGAYAIQEWIGAVGIRNINGSFYNVMGLPVDRVISIL